MTAPDLPLYLSLAALQRPSPGTILNPYYHVEVPANGAGFLKFRLGPLLYSYLTRLLSGQMWWSLFVWNAGWWALTCIAAVWLFDGFLPCRRTLMVLAGLAMLMFFNLGMAKEQIIAWLHFPSLSTFGEIGLPYIRSFSPQVIMPVVLVYLGLQMLAFANRGAWWVWASMTVLQLFAFAVFPYATLLMAGITAVAIAGLLLTGKNLDWRCIAVYGIVCAIVDTTFLLHGKPVFGASANSFSIFHFEWTILRAQMGKLWLFLGLLTVLAGRNRRLLPEVRWTLVGLGLSNMLMLLGDGFIPAPPFFITNHASYFEHASLVVLMVFLASAIFSKLNLATDTVRLALAVLTGFFLLNGILLAESGARRMIPFNREQADMAHWFALGEPGPGDLVIVQHDACGWVPFLSSAQVLFCRNAQAMLSPEQNRDLQRRREAWYLYFLGKDSRWVNRVSQDPGEVHRLETYGMYGEVSSYVGAQLIQQLAMTRAELLPPLEEIERHDPQASEFLRQFKHVWIVDDGRTPIFQRFLLDQFLEVRSEMRSGDLIVLSSTPR